MPQANELKELSGILTSWVASVAVVAYTFAPLTICRWTLSHQRRVGVHFGSLTLVRHRRSLTFVGISHNVIEWSLILHLGGCSVPAERRTRGQSLVRTTVAVWLFCETVGGLVLGDITTQWIVFGLMGCIADLVMLVTSTLRLFRSSRTSIMQPLWLAIFSHSIYVAFFFLNCIWQPPVGKVLGVYLNAVAVSCAMWAVFRIRCALEATVPRQSPKRRLNFSHAVAYSQ